MKARDHVLLIAETNELGSLGCLVGVDYGRLVSDDADAEA